MSSQDMSTRTHIRSCQRTALLDALIASGLYVHALPGRLRIEAPALRGDTILASRLYILLRSLPGVLDVQTHSTTGRVLIQFDARSLDHEFLVSQMDKLHCFTLPPGPEEVRFQPKEPGLAAFPQAARCQERRCCKKPQSDSSLGRIFLRTLFEELSRAIIVRLISLIL